MRFFQFLFLLCSVTAFNLARAESPEAPHTQCVAKCEQRTFTGRCLRYGPDYCGIGPGIACIPWCQQRTMQGRCLGYGVDFCGYEPSCAPQCGEYGPSGRSCLKYLQDACFQG